MHANRAAITLHWNLALGIQPLSIEAPPPAPLGQFVFGYGVHISVRGAVCDFDFGSFVSAFDLELFDGEANIFRSVVSDKPRIPEAINEVFRAKVVRVDESAPIASNANRNAACVFFFSRCRSNGVIANNRLRLGTGCRTTIFISS